MRATGESKTAGVKGRRFRFPSFFSFLRLFFIFLERGLTGSEVRSTLAAASLGVLGHPSLARALIESERALERAKGRADDSRKKKRLRERRFLFFFFESDFFFPFHSLLNKRRKHLSRPHPPLPR